MAYTGTPAQRESARIRTQRRRENSREKVRAEAKKWADANKDKTAIRRTRWKENNPDRAKDLASIRLYGVSLEGRRKMYEDQKGLCAVCQTPLPPDYRNACLDHDHKSGKARELTFRRCNMLVGIDESNPELFVMVKNYVGKWRTFLAV